MFRSRPRRARATAGAAALTALAVALSPGAPHPAGAEPPAAPIWPVPELRDGVRQLLVTFYAQRADPDEDDYTFRAPRGEADKKKAWKDPDTLWEFFGGSPGTSCHGVVGDAAFIDCTGHRLARTFGLPYAGGLTLFDASRGFYANDSYAQIAGYYALYHAFLRDHDAPDDSPTYTPAGARSSKRYHERMIKAYEAHMRNIVVKHFLDPGATAGNEYQSALTRSIGLTAAMYASVAQAMEQQGIWAKGSGDRMYAIALINGLDQRLFWEWIWPGRDGPRTAGLQPFGSYNDYHLAATARPELVGKDAFFWGSMRMGSLRPLAYNVAPHNGLTIDADYTVPGEWWCMGAYAAGADRDKCMQLARSESLGGASSPFGHFYGDPACASRPGSITPSSCGSTNAGSVAEEWTWSLLGAHKGMFLVKALVDAGEPQSPVGAMGATQHEVKPGVWSSELAMAADRLGYGVAGWHGGEGRQDDLEWEWHRDGAAAQPIRTLSAGTHDLETQNGAFSLGEPLGDPLSSGRDGDTWAADRQDYPGAMENHAPGPHPMYGTLLFGLTLWDQVADGGSGLAGSFFDTAARNHPDEFLAWVKLLASTYYRCPNVSDPLDAACADFAGSDRQPLFTRPDDSGVPVRFRYLWRDEGPAWLLHPSRVAESDPAGMGIPTCRVQSGLPWREVHAFGETGNPARLDEGGYGAYNSLVQGLGGFMRVAAARYPLAAPSAELEAGYDEQRSAVLAPWFAESYGLVAGILELYRDEVGGYGYVPDIENSACIGDDPTAPGQRMVLTWRQGTGESVHQTTVRRAMWYSVLAVWNLWYDSTWLDVDPAVWIAR